MTITTILAYSIASGVGSGYAKKAPGTFGSLAFLLLWFIGQALLKLNFQFFICTLIAMAVFGSASVELCLKNEKLLQKQSDDPGWIVIDEWLGLGVALLPLSFFENTGMNFYIMSFAAFGLFRLFDILKPFPISTLEKLPSSLGIMSDDLLAGIFAAGILTAIL